MNWKLGRQLLALSGGCVLGAGIAMAQGGKTVEANINAHVVEVARVEPTSTRINGLKLPVGFKITKFAEMQNPRMIAVADDGTVYVSQRDSGTLVMLRDTNGDGRADVQRVVATRKALHGIALRGNQLYFVTVKELYRATRKPDGTLTTPQLLLKNLPDAGQHPNRTIAFGPDGKLYITVGSTCNVCDETNAENATILRAQPDGKNRKIFASGLRNTIGFGWHPFSRRMFGMDNGIDWLGDEAQREELNEIKMGKRYGWPYVYENGKPTPHPQTPPAYTKAMWARMSVDPSLTYQAHAASLQMAFYNGHQFPAEYRGDAFVAMRGSWNRNPPSGYEVVRIHFNRNGTPLSITPFLTGFLLPGAGPNGTPGQFARLAGVAVAKDGALLVADDTNNIVYRVSYGAKNLKRAQTSAMDARQIALKLPETASAQSTITVRSINFPPGSKIPFRHTAYDKNVSPELHWSGVPRGAKSLVLMMEDPISMSPKPFIHWLMANIAPASTRISGNLPDNGKAMRVGSAMQGTNSTGQFGYFGPKPPADGLTHEYHFQLFALDKKLNLPVGFNRQALLDAMRGHVLAKGEVVGTVKR